MPLDEIEAAEEEAAVAAAAAPAYALTVEAAEEGKEGVELPAVGEVRCSLWCCVH